MENFIKYITRNYEIIIKELLNHLSIIGIALPFAVIIGVSVGIIIAGKPKISKIIIYISGMFMTIPSPALFGIMIILLAPFNAGLGKPPAVIALIIYSLLPMIRNTVNAVNSLDHNIIEIGRAHV